MELPEPDRLTEPRFVPELRLVEVVYSDDGYARVAITRDQANLYRIHPERWDVSDFTVIGEAYWNSWGHDSSIAGDMEIARALAREALHRIPRSEVLPDEV